MKTPEAKEKDEIDKYLKLIGAYVVKSATFGFGASGHPDRVCCIGGRFVSIEVKRPGKEPTPIQERRMNEVRATGGVAFWGTSEKVITEMKLWFINDSLKQISPR